MNIRGGKGNILLVANYESDVGYAWKLMENFWAVIADYYEKKNRKCFLIYPKITTIPPIIENSPIIVIEHNFSRITKQSRAKLKKIIKENNIRAIYLNDRKRLDFNYIFLRMWGVNSIVVHLHWGGHGFKKLGSAKILSTIPQFIKSLIFSIKVITCDYYIAVSSLIYHELIKYIPKQKCICIVNGIKPIVVEGCRRNYANNSFGIPEEAVIVVSTGRATYQKGIDFIVQCADIIINNDKCKNLYFLHCGDGPDLLAFKRKVKEFNLDDKFLFAGKRTDVPDILQSCHIGIQASEGEAFSLSILEYMSAGLATMIPNDSGNCEAISNEVNGVCYPPRDHKYAVRWIKELAENIELREKLGVAAAKTVYDSYNIDKTNKELLAFLSGKL